MCGIAGLVTLDGPPPDLATLERMTQTLVHRGPDTHGYFLDVDAQPGVGLGHRRLSVIDLSASANQPISNEDGNVRVILNGEIYNFQELRAQLERNHSFRSQGDAEVIAHLYEERGLDAIPALDGMFALALWDRRKRRLLLARDALGKKPLYYWCDGRRFLFASEIKALLAGGATVALDDRRVGEYLAHGYVPTPNTLFAGIKKAPPASVLTVTAAGPKILPPYWRLEFPAIGESRSVSLHEAAQSVRRHLQDAVRKRLVADVPVGVLLSGGADSSAVAAAITKTGRSVKTFAIGFEGPGYFDERPHARRVAHHLGTEHQDFLVKPDATSLIEELLFHYDEPFGDSSALPTYLVAREARKQVTVVLNGDGGDEAFAGYEQFRIALLAERIPARLRRALGALAEFLPAATRSNSPLAKLRRFALKAKRPLDQRIFAWSNYTDVPLVERLVAPHLFDRGAILASYRQALQECDGQQSLLSRLLFLSARTFLLDDLLPKMDRMTMAHGLEARSPLLDKALITHAAGLPDNVKRRGRHGKLCLKAAIRPWLPAGVLDRPKHGFGVPINHWFRSELTDMVESTLLDKPRLGSLLAPSALSRLVAEHRSGREDRGNQLWILLTLELWLRQHRLP